jgi:hypothetical protein
MVSIPLNRVHVVSSRYSIVSFMPSSFPMHTNRSLLVYPVGSSYYIWAGLDDGLEVYMGI